MESAGGTHKACGLSLSTSLCFGVSGCGSKAFSIATVHPSEPDWRPGWTLVILAYCLLSTLQKYSYCPICPMPLLPPLSCKGSIVTGHPYRPAGSCKMGRPGVQLPSREVAGGSQPRSLDDLPESTFRPGFLDWVHQGNTVSVMLQLI